MESVCDLDNMQFPSPWGLVNKLNEALPIILKSWRPGMKPDLCIEVA